MEQSNIFKLSRCEVKFVKSPADEKKFWFELDDGCLERPLKMYKPSLLKFIEYMPKAQALAAKVRQGWKDGEVMNVGINQFNNVYIRLIVDVYNGKANINLRLMFVSEEGNLLPTRINLLFGTDDNIAELKKFVYAVSPLPKALCQMNDFIYTENE